MKWLRDTDHEFDDVINSLFDSDNHVISGSFRDINDYLGINQGGRNAANIIAVSFSEDETCDGLEKWYIEWSVPDRAMMLGYIIIEVPKNNIMDAFNGAIGSNANTVHQAGWQRLKENLLKAGEQK